MSGRQRKGRRKKAATNMHPLPKTYLIVGEFFGGSRDGERFMPFGGLTGKIECDGGTYSLVGFKEGVVNGFAIDIAVYQWGV
jgi:hypothetical protein